MRVPLTAAKSLSISVIRYSKLILSQIIAYLSALPTHHNRGGLAMTAEPWPWPVWGPRVPWQDFPLPGLMPLGFQSSASEDPMTPVVWPLVPNTGPDTQATGTGKSSPSESRWLPILTHR